MLVVKTHKYILKNCDFGINIYFGNSSILPPICVYRLCIATVVTSGS